MSETTNPTRPAPIRPAAPARPPASARAMDAVEEFERFYRANVDAITAYFARRSTDPQTVADLTADTFVQAITSFGAYDPDRGGERAWVFGIARRIHAAHCAAHAMQREKHSRLAGRRELDEDQFGELLDRIAAEHEGRLLVDGLAELSAADRALVELVDLDGLSAREAAALLGLAPGAARMRLMRARGRLRKYLAQERAYRIDSDPPSPGSE